MNKHVLIYTKLNAGSEPIYKAVCWLCTAYKSKWYYYKGHAELAWRAHARIKHPGVTL